MCDFLDFECKSKEWAASTLGDALTNAANAVLEAVGKGLASLGTVWVNIGTPNLTGGSGDGGVDPASSAGNVGGINTILGYVTWISFGLAILSLIALGVRMGSLRRREAAEEVGRLGIVLGAVVLTSAASGLITALLPQAQGAGSPAVAFIQNSLWWYMAAAAMLSVIIGGARMAWEQRAEPGRDLVRSLLTLIVVSGAGLTIVGLLVAASDSFAVWLLNGSLKCDVGNRDGTCFGGNMATLLALTTNPATGGLGSILIIVLGLLAVLVSLVQIILMLARGGMLVILAGILPVSASATNTEMGRTWFKRCVAWLTAFILYKPAAAIVYATAFKLAGTSVFKDDGSGLISILTGLTLMTVALVALPALMRFVTPLVGSLASGGAAAGMALAGAAALPSGAAAVGRLMGGQSGGGGGGNSSSGGPNDSTSQPGGAGPGGTGNTGSQGAPGSGSPGSPGAGGGPGTPGSGGLTGSSGGTGAVGGTGPGAAGGGAGAGAGGAAAGGAAAAAGPPGLVVAAGAAAVQKAGAAAQSAAAAAGSIGESSTGEGGPSGSR